MDIQQERDNVKEANSNYRTFLEKYIKEKCRWRTPAQVVQEFVSTFPLNPKKVDLYKLHPDRHPKEHVLYSCLFAFAGQQWPRL